MAQHLQRLSIEDDDDENFLLVAAIDFGTAFSGYAFALNQKSKTKGKADTPIIMNKNWGESLGYQSYKTPTSVLLDKCGKLVAFGYDAEEKYASSEDSSGFHLFRQFKMSLFKKQGEEKLSKDIRLQALDRTWHRGIDVFAESLKFFKDHLSAAVQQSSGKSVDPTMIKWVLTVPAIWKDEAKQFMREAALQAGLIENIGSRKLLIALEPEGASIECRSVDIADFHKPDMDVDSFKKLAHKAGTRYLVVDAGGGTIDITGHEILPTNDVKEILAPSGGDWGGMQIDENFTRLLKGIFGSNFINQFKKDSPRDWLQLTMAFQTVKCSAKASGDQPIRVQIPWNMPQKYSEMQGQQLEKAVNSQSKRGVKFANGYLIIDPAETRRVFEPVVQQTARHVMVLLQKPQMASCKFIFLVGGFGTSSFLYEALASAVKPPVLVPPEAQMAVLKGAVRFGLNPLTVRARIARKTYGRSRCSTKIQQHPRKDKIVTEKGITFVKDLFTVFIGKDDVVEVGSVVTHTGLPMFDDQTTVICALAASDLSPDEIQYIDDPGVEIVGRLQLIIPPMDVSKHERKLEYKFTFGGTEILVEGRDILSGNVTKTVVDFFSS